MYQSWKEKISHLIKSRILYLYIVFILLGAGLIYRIFMLQIVNGEQYLENYQLKIIKERSVSSTRGKIYDRNGNILAYDEIAYNITFEDTFEDNKGKNQKLNDTLLKLIDLIEENDDQIISDFGIYVNEDNQYVFSVSDTKLARFLADIYGKKKITDLDYDERNSTPDDVINYLCGEKKYKIGDYMDPEDTNTFVPGLGMNKRDVLKLCILRYYLSLNSYKKYVATVVANDVSYETLAVVMENSSELPGVSVSSSTIRRYNEGVYFSQIIGYTGRISTEEYEELSQLDDNYTSNDNVGKTGIENSMESYLQGKKGSETIYVDVTGRILDTSDYIRPVSGSDVYLTIDKDLQIAVYHILEQKVAGILVSKIRNVKEYNHPEGASASSIIIPIDDVYNALFENNVIDTSRFSKDYASDIEKDVYQTYLANQSSTLDSIRVQLESGTTPYNKLSKENKAYQSFIISMLSSDNNGILIKEKIDKEDTVYKAWTNEETISISDYLHYCISQNWVDTSNLNIDEKYSDSDEIYSALIEYIISKLENNTEFSKKIYKYMILNNSISGKQICMILYNQDIINVDESKIKALKNNKISSYQFMVDCISDLSITPAQLALNPCSASCVITDVNSGNVLALVSYPSYDNNKLANSADSSYLYKLNNDASMPLWNYATQHKCAPGSTFKMVSSVAGMEEGVIDTKENILCTGYFDKLTGVTHKCWIAPGRHGNLNVTEGIANSCNCFFYEVGYRLATDEDGYNDTYGIERLYKYADLFGLSEKSGVEIAESEPHVSDAFPVPTAIGQGTAAYTTVGLSRYVTAVANSGTVYNLTLIDKVIDANGKCVLDNSATVRNTVDISSSEWNAIHNGMRKVVQSKNYFDIGVEVAGKTGTAQESASKPNHALFVGYAPFNSPEISIATRIMNGYSSDFAAQASKDVFMYYYNLAGEEELITGTADQPLSAGTAGD